MAFMALLFPVLASCQTIILSNVTFSIHAISNFPPAITNLAIVRSNSIIDVYLQASDGTQFFTNPPTSTRTNGFVLSESLGTPRNDFGGFVGMKIQVGASPVTVSSLGRMMLSGNTGSHLVKLVNASDGSDISGGSMSVSMNGISGQFQYVPLLSPVTLAAGGSYFLVSQESANGDQWYDVDTTVTTTQSAQVLSAVWGYGPGHWYLAGTTNHCYVPLDFK